MSKILAFVGIIILAVAFSVATYGLAITKVETGLTKEVYYGIVVGIIGAIVLGLGLGRD